MRNWSASTKVTLALVVALLGWAWVRSVHYDRMAKTVAHEVATPSAVANARTLVVKKKLARLFKDRPEQAKKQAIRTASVLVADRSVVVVEGHHLPVAEAAAGALVEFLSDLDLPVRAAAADALGRMGKCAATPLIGSALTSPDKDVRSNAAHALTIIGDVAVPEMVNAINGGSPSQKVGCAAAVGKLRTPRAIGALVGALSAKEEEVRLACRDSLVAMKKPAVKALIGALGNKDAFTRQHASEALGEIGDKDAGAPLIKVLDDENRLVRLAAAYAVGKVKDSAATQPLMARLKDTDRETREAAAVSLGQIADQAAVSSLTSALYDSVDKVREQAAAALGRIAPSDGGSLSAIAAATRAAEEGTRSAAVFALGRIGNTASVSAIVDRLGSAESSETVKRRAATALSELKSPAAIGALLAAFGSEDWHVTYAAEQGLAAIGGEAVAPLVNLLGSDDWLRARYARKALVRMKPAPVAALAAVLDGRNAAARLNATIALGEIRDGAAQALLDKLANDADPLVKEAATHAKLVRGGASDDAALAPAPKSGKPAESAAPAAEAGQ